MSFVGNPTHRSLFTALAHREEQRPRDVRVGDRLLATAFTVDGARCEGEISRINGLSHFTGKCSLKEDGAVAQKGFGNA